MSNCSKMMILFFSRTRARRRRVGRRLATSHPHPTKVLLHDNSVPIPTRAQALPSGAPPPSLQSPQPPARSQTLPSCGRPHSSMCSEHPKAPSTTPPTPKPPQKTFFRQKSRPRSPLPFGGGQGSLVRVASSCGSGGALLLLLRRRCMRQLLIVSGQGSW